MTVLNKHKFECSSLHEFYEDYMMEEEIKMVKVKYRIDRPFLGFVMDNDVSDEEVIRFVLDSRDEDYIINYNGDYFEIYEITNEEVLEYFNKYIVHNEYLTHVYQCKIQSLNDVVEYSDNPIKKFPSHETEFYDTKEDQVVAYSKKHVLEYIKGLLSS